MPWPVWLAMLLGLATLELRPCGSGLRGFEDGVVLPRRLQKLLAPYVADATRMLRELEQSKYGDSAHSS